MHVTTSDSKSAQWHWTEWEKGQITEGMQSAITLQQVNSSVITPFSVDHQDLGL